METTEICKNCQTLSTENLGLHKNKTKRLCCEKPEFIPLKEYLKNSVYRPGSNEIDIRAKVIGVLYSSKNDNEIVNKLKSIL